MGHLRQDLRFAIRHFRRSPGLAITAVITLALGLGGAAAIFTVVNGVLLTPLPYPNPQRIIEISSRYQDGPDYHVIRAAQFRFLQERSRSFDSMALRDVVASGVNLSGNGEPEQVTASFVSAGFFQVLGVMPVLGRAFTSADEQPGGGCVAILSNGLWRAKYNRNSAILTDPITVNGESCSVAGVLPPGFWSQQDARIFMPLKIAAAPRDLGHYYNLLARMKAGVTETQARDESAALFPQFKSAHGDLVDDGEAGFEEIRYEDAVLGNVRPALWALFGAVCFLLMIACVNVAHLQISRALTRTREMAVRAALGASRLRLARQLLTESALLAFAGGACGLLLAYAGVPLLLHLSPAALPRASEISINLSVVAFCLVASVFTVLIFGLVPALSASSVDLNRALRAAGCQVTAGTTARLARSLLIATEVALSLLLLVGASLLMRSFFNLQRVAPGFDPQNILAFKMSIPPRYSSTSRMWDFERKLLARLDALPGVASVASATCLPLEAGPDMPGTVLGHAPPNAFNPAYRPVSPSYFHVLRIPVLRGRSFMDSDTPKSLPVAIINASLARQLFPDREPIGRTLQLGTGLGGQYADTPRVIVGVVADVHEASLSAAPGPTVFIPRAQVPDALTPPMNRALPMSWAVRTKVPPDQLIGAVREAVWAVDPQMPAADLHTMKQAISIATGRQRFTFVLMSIFAALAMMMAAVGIYGVVTFQMRQRQRELGIRLALGALPRSLVRTITIQEARPIAAGMFAGAMASIFLVRLIRSLLFETSLADPVSFLSSAVVLGIIGCLSCYLPVSRASRMDPLQILREE